MNDWVVGVDLGGTKVALGLIDPSDTIVARRRIATNADDGPEAVVARIGDSVAELRGEIPSGGSIAALGICAPGPLDHETGVIINPTNLPKFYNTPLRQMLTDHLKMPVALEHDAKAAALGEFHHGAGRDVRSMVYVVVGTGVGAAIIIDGQLYRGLRNFAGEIGFVTIDRDGELGNSGMRGCLDIYTSGPWLAKRYLAASKLEGSARNAAEDHVTGGYVAAQAEAGDPLALRIIAEAGEALGTAVGTMAMILDIERYIIGGSVAKCGDLLLEPARQTVPKYSFATVASRVEIVGSELGEDAPILGSAYLARQRAGGATM